MARFAVLAIALVAGCGGAGPDLDAARTFDRHPLYWVGERFEDWQLEDVDVESAPFVLLVYGTCEIDDPDGLLGPEGGSCSPPFQIQIQPLCAQLAAVTSAPMWRRREIRGAPVGTIDSAPVLLTSRVQVKVYRGQGSDPGLPLRVLGALRSLNEVAPVLDADDPIPPPPREVLEGSAPCV